MKILVVDDEALLVKGIRFNLQNEGYEVITGSDGLEAVSLVQQQNPDLVILDVMMPNMDGMTACGKIREFSDVPIILLTAKTDDMDKLMGFDHGADDYLTKPFNILELKARIRALLRRPAAVRSTGFCRGDVELSRQRGVLKGPSGECTVSNREAALLYIFLSNPGQVLSRETILVRIWGQGSEVTERNIDNFVYLIRRRLSNVGSAITIHTVRGCGYRAEVSNA